MKDSAFVQQFQHARSGEFSAEDTLAAEDIISSMVVTDEPRILIHAQITMQSSNPLPRAGGFLFLTSLPTVAMTR